MNLLIVNDEQLTAETMKKDMDWASYGISEVYTAYDTEAARACIAEHPVDILLCDIEMPGGNGLGPQLYGALERVLAAQNVLNCNACIALPQTEDATLTQASVRFHQRMGYTLVGQFHQVGYKFDRWYHMVWMEKALGAHTVPPAPFIPFPQIAEQVCPAGQRYDKTFSRRRWSRG